MSDYQLVWSDEFNKPGAPDPKNWNFESGFARNHEDQWYQAGNARIQNGRLIIEARRENKTNPLYDASKPDWRNQRERIKYTSSSLTTNGLRFFTYGRFEMRGKIDIRSGMWPAWWMVGSQGEWPSGGEIDMMEFYRGKLLANVAWGTSKRWTAAWDSSEKEITSFGDSKWSEKFHTWQMDWTPGLIVLSVDGVVLNSTDLTKTLNADGSNPFTKPHFMILNLAIGGDNGGDPSATQFPARFEVDWVRVYQKK